MHAGMIARIWRGATRAADAERYLEYLEATGLSAYRVTPGNLGAFVLRRVEDERAVFTLVTIWASMDAIRRFAGDDVTRAVFYPEDDAFLVERDERVEHVDVPWASAEAFTPPAR